MSLGKPSKSKDSPDYVHSIFVFSTTKAKGTSSSQRLSRYERFQRRQVPYNPTGFLDKLTYGDLVLADRGFDIADDLALVGASLAIPPFTRGKPQLSQREVDTARALSCVRIQVERAIGRMKNFKILQTTLPIKLIKRPHETEYITIDKILIVCSALCNLHPKLID